MEKDKLIFRKEYLQIPSKVEYGLLERGEVFSTYIGYALPMGK